MKNKKLWERICNFGFDSPQDEKKFHHRLQERYDWDEFYALHVISEFRRFCYIWALGNRVSPSTAIDECWHMLILDTQLYKTFCDEVLGTFFHHLPEKIGSEKKKYQDWHEKNREIYMQEFGNPPPEAVWQNYRIISVNTYEKLIIPKKQAVAVVVIMGVMLIGFLMFV